MPDDQYRNPYEVFDGTNLLVIHANHMRKAVAGASLDHCIDAALPLASVVSAMINDLSGPIKHIAGQEVAHRSLVPLAEGEHPSIDNDPDPSFKTWCRAADAYYVLIGQPHGRFRFDHPRKYFSGYYQAGWSAIKAFEHLDQKIRKNQRPVTPTDRALMPKKARSPLKREMP